MTGNKHLRLHGSVVWAQHRYENRKLQKEKAGLKRQIKKSFQQLIPKVLSNFSVGEILLPIVLGGVRTYNINNNKNNIYQQALV